MRFSSLPGFAGWLVLLLLAACTSPMQKDAEPVRESTKSEKVAVPVATPLPAPVDKAQQALLDGIASYENGRYTLAARQFQSALALGLERREEQARAHKYLAFLSCVRGNRRQCRDEFRKALAADPGFDLSPAEAGHPTWGPVFRKLRTAKK